jgi:hypothetical protein
MSDLQLFRLVGSLATDYRPRKVHHDRIDTLGLDENGCPLTCDTELVIATPADWERAKPYLPHAYVHQLLELL